MKFDWGGCLTQLILWIIAVTITGKVYVETGGSEWAAIMALVILVVVFYLLLELINHVNK